MRAAAVAVVLAGVLALVVVLTSASAPPARSAPPLPKELLAGREASLATLHGKPALIDFFASWCGPCIAEAPTIARAQRALGNRARLVTVDWSDSRRYALAFVHRYHWSMPVLADPDGTSGYAYGVQGLPSMFVLDAHGRIVKRLVGPQTIPGIVAAVDHAG